MVGAIACVPIGLKGLSVLIFQLFMYIPHEICVSSKQNKDLNFEVTIAIQKIIQFILLSLSNINHENYVSIYTIVIGVVPEIVRGYKLECMTTLLLCRRREAIAIISEIKINWMHGIF